MEAKCQTFQNTLCGIYPSQGGGGGGGGGKVPNISKYVSISLLLSFLTLCYFVFFSSSFTSLIFNNKSLIVKTNFVIIFINSIFF